jgi:hypothetical protein
MISHASVDVLSFSPPHFPLQVFDDSTTAFTGLAGDSPELNVWEETEDLGVCC